MIQTRIKKTKNELILREDIFMARPKKNVTVNEEANGTPVEEKKPARRGRPRKNPLPEVKAEETAGETPVGAAEEVK